MKYLVVLLLLVTPALAQQFTPEQTAAITLGQQIGALSFDLGTVRSSLLKAQAEIEKRDKEIEELKKQLEKKDAK